MLTLAREAGLRGGTFPCAFNAANEVAVAAFLDGPHRLPRDRRDRRATRSTPSPAIAAADLDELLEADAEARALAETALQPHELLRSPSSGLAFLILIHEAGHFFASLAVGMRPRKFYIGFPPALVEDEAERDRVRHRRDPARRLRPHPRDAPPAAKDVDLASPRAPRGARARRARPSG